MSESIVSLINVNLVLKITSFRGWSWKDLIISKRQDVSPLFGKEGRLHIIKNLNLKINVGDRIGIIGKNGTGKTTLCRCIAGIYHPTSGSVIRKGKVNAIFDTAVGIQPELTGRENVKLLADFFFPLDPHKAEKIDEALALSDLGEFLDVPYRVYSAGMQTRLRLSLIAVHPSDLLILDEVFDGADIAFRKKISVRMLQLIASSGAVIFVSHSLEQIKEICTRVIVLDKGTIAFDGDVDAGLKFYERLVSS